MNKSKKTLNQKIIKIFKNCNKWNKKKGLVKYNIKKLFNQLKKMLNNKMYIKILKINKKYNKSLMCIKKQNMG